MIYFATPYTHENEAIREKRYTEAIASCYRLTICGHTLFSPIIQTHDMVCTFKIPFKFDRWESWCHDFISSSRLFLVACMDGWETSQGVSRESSYARSIGVPVRFLWRDDLYMPDEDLANFTFHEFPQGGDHWPL
jgi:hypothetical protein